LRVNCKKRFKNVKRDAAGYVYVFVSNSLEYVSAKKNSKIACQRYQKSKNGDVFVYLATVLWNERAIVCCIAGVRLRAWPASITVADQLWLVHFARIQPGRIWIFQHYGNHPPTLRRSSLI